MHTYCLCKEQIVSETTGRGTLAQFMLGLRHSRNQVRHTTSTVIRCTRGVLTVAAHRLFERNWHCTVYTHP